MGAKSIFQLFVFAVGLEVNRRPVCTELVKEKLFFFSS